MKGGYSECSFIVNPVHNAFQNTVMNFTVHYAESSVFVLFKAALKQEHTKKLKQSNANNMCSSGCKKLKLLLCKKTQQLLPFVPLTHLGFHANEDIVFSSTSPDGRIRLKGK